jgi:hypothetical protein
MMLLISSDNLFGTEDTGIPLLILSNTGSFPWTCSYSWNDRYVEQFPDLGVLLKITMGMTRTQLLEITLVLGGEDSPSEHGPGPGMGLGAPDKEKDKT